MRGKLISRITSTMSNRHCENDKGVRGNLKCDNYLLRDYPTMSTMIGLIRFLSICKINHPQNSQLRTLNSELL